MAFELDYTDDYAFNYPASYWRVVQTNLSQSSKTGQIVLHGFIDEANKDKRIIGFKQYIVSNGDYETYFEADALNPNGKNPVTAAYTYAKATDSFFASAVDV